MNHSGANESFPEFISRADVARLIPHFADSSKEQRVVSAFLATMTAVDEFGRSLLRMLGAPAPKTARIAGYTEVEFAANAGSNENLRPDGLIFVGTPRRNWSMLVEAKVGNAELTKEQVEAYLRLAKLNGIEALVTISNQFAPLPTHHPVPVSRARTKKVELYHWSWTSILAEAIIIAGDKGVADPDQAFILNEFIRYLEHEGSGVNPFPKIGKGWKEVSNSVRHGVRPPTRELEDTVGEWQQLSRFLSLKLGMMLERNVTEVISRTHQRNPQARLRDNCNQFLKTSCLEAKLDVPNAASEIKLAVHLDSKTVAASAELQAPTDRTRATSLVTWILNQLGHCEDEDLLVRAMWPGRAPDTCVALGRLREDKKAVLTSDQTLMPRAFEIIRMIDTKSRIGSRPFVEELATILPNFYRDVGQHLKAWVPPAPKVKPTGEKGKEGLETASATEQEDDEAGQRSEP